MRSNPAWSSVGAFDPVTFAVVPGIIAAVARVAGALPAIRAARVVPVEAMRTN